MGLEEKRQEREIEGVVYEMLPLPFGTGRPALVRAVKVIGPLVSGLLRGSNGKITKLTDIAPSAVAGILDAIPATISDDDLTYFARLFGDSSRYREGDRWVPLIEQNQAAHFEGRYLAFFRWLIFGMEVNFAGFFGGMLNRAAAGVPTDSA